MNKVIFALAIIFSVINAQSICDRYASAPAFGNSSVLVGAAVTGTVGRILAGEGGLKKFFDGTFTVKTDFTLNTTAFGKLAGDLIAFFQSALGCTDAAVTPYTGRPMAEAHAGMNITFADINAFNVIVATTVKGAGFAQNDTDATATALNNLIPSICTLPDCMTICNRYSKPYIANNSALVGHVVGEVVNAALGDTTLRQFFDGTIPTGSKNFTDPANAADFGNLAAHLIQFFGQVLGCSDKSIPQYDGNPDMKAVHAKMPITNAVFTGFNAAVVGVMKAAGVAQADLDTVANVLEGTRAAICNQPDCMTNTTTGGTNATTSDTGATTGSTTGATTGASSTTGSAISIAIASFFALIALLI